MASYTVKKGDSWWKIAQEQMGSGAKYADLAKYNNMNLNKTIQPGMTINIPSATAKASRFSHISRQRKLSPDECGNRATDIHTERCSQKRANSLKQLEQQEAGCISKQISVTDRFHS